VFSFSLKISSSNSDDDDVDAIFSEELFTKKDASSILVYEKHWGKAKYILSLFCFERTQQAVSLSCTKEKLDCELVLGERVEYTRKARLK